MRLGLRLKRFGTTELNCPTTESLISSPCCALVEPLQTLLIHNVNFAEERRSLFVIELHAAVIIGSDEHEVSGMGTRSGVTTATLTPTLAALFSWFLSHHALEISAIPKKNIKSRIMRSAVSTIVWPFCQYFSLLKYKFQPFILLENKKGGYPPFF
jgi:hypothetical protein